MANLLALFRKNVETVAAEHRKASDELMSRLKKLTPAGLLRCGNNVWSELTIDQFREIVKTIAPEVRMPDPPREKIIQPRNSEKFKHWWRARSAAIRSAYLTVVASVLIVPVITVAWPKIAWTLVPFRLVRTINPVFWPPCGRLAWNTDGCVYVPTQDLNWDWVTYQLDMNLDELQRSNTHLPTTFVPKGSKITIWRSRGRLSGYTP